MALLHLAMLLCSRWQSAQLFPSASADIKCQGSVYLSLMSMTETHKLLQSI